MTDFLLLSLGVISAVVRRAAVLCKAAKLSDLTGGDGRRLATGPCSLKVTEREGGRERERERMKVP